MSDALVVVETWQAQSCQGFHCKGLDTVDATVHPYAILAVWVPPVEEDRTSVRYLRPVSRLFGPTYKVKSTHPSLEIAEAVVDQHRRDQAFVDWTPENLAHAGI